MKSVLVFGIFLCCVVFASSTVTTPSTPKSKMYNCKSQYSFSENLDIEKKFKNMTRNCTNAMKKQVTRELEASLTYLSMAARFSEDRMNRPGFAKMFFESASEEREHAIKFIDYLLMRGELENGIKELIKNPIPSANTWNSGLDALKDALKLEMDVTESISKIIQTCESPINDYHLVDYLTGVFLEEQFKGQRDLAGHISVLGKMITSMGDLGEYMFDKKLLNGELPALG